MIELSFSVASEKLGARHIGPEGHFSAVSTDSRTLSDGDLFVALVGPNFDGHDYLELAADRGASGAMVQREAATELPLLQVDDTLKVGRACRPVATERRGLPGGGHRQQR